MCSCNYERKKANRPKDVCRLMGANKVIRLGLELFIFRCSYGMAGDETFLQPHLPGLRALEVKCRYKAGIAEP